MPLLALVALLLMAEWLLLSVQECVNGPDFTGVACKTLQYALWLPYGPIVNIRMAALEGVRYLSYRH